ncbi:MAG: DUF1565 domain-containing protein [Planctomycetota bacterium]
MNSFHCISLSLFCCASLCAADLYVAPTGDDKNAGSKDAPLKTIQAGIDKAQPGDSVLVEKGVYRERFIGKKSGTDSARVTIKSSPRRAAIMEGFELAGSYVTIEGFQVTHGFGSFVGTGIDCKGNNNLITDNYIFEVRKQGLSVSGNANQVVKNKIYKPCQGMGAQGKDYLIEGNDISRVYNYGYLDGDYARFFGENGVWRGNFLHGNIMSERAGHPDGFQTFDDNGEYVKNMLFENNLIGDTVAAGMLQAWYSKNSGGLIFRRNVFYNLQQGLSGGTIPNLTIENNTFYNIIERCGEGGPGSVWKNNIYVNCRSTVSSDYSLFYKVAGKKPGSGCVPGEADPLLVDPDQLDFRLKPGSPAIDAGDPATITPEGGGGRVDLGAYEYIPSTSAK